MNNADQAPPRVRNAVRLLWASAVLGVADSAYEFADPAPEFAEYAGPVLGAVLGLTAVYCLFVYLVSRRRSWARYVLLSWLVAGTVAYVVLPAAEGEQWWETSANWGSILLEGIAMYLLFTGEAVQWFRKKVAVQVRSPDS